MRAANRLRLVLIGLAAATAACRQSPPEQNLAAVNKAATPTDIEALPPDESAATPTNELNAGDDEASNVDEPSNAANQD
jgi:hypothetical protein